MNKGSSVYNFVILDIVNLEELKAQGIWARHKSGAEIFHVLNDDPENLFGFAFSTAQVLQSCMPNRLYSFDPRIVNLFLKYNVVVVHHNYFAVFSGLPEPG